MIKSRSGRTTDTDEVRLFITTSSMAIYGLMKCWLTEDIQKTPHDIVMIIDRIFGLKTYYSALEEFSR